MPVNLDRIRKQRHQVWMESAARWQARQARRQEAVRTLRARREADDPERVLAFASREARRPGCSPAFRAVVRTALEAPGSATEKVKVLERRIGPSLDWAVAPSGVDADAAGQSVGRICSAPDAIPGVGFATGFLVSPSLLLTNHHVFAEGKDARGTYVQFGYELADGATQPGTFFELDPGLFFTSDGDLDFALVGVKPVSVDGRDELEEYRPNRLIAEPGKILVGHRISIIQHPEGGTKRYAERENELLDVLDDFLQYSTDTLPGSSGSPCFNEAWEVVALHHSGVPRTKGGKILRVDGSPWDPSMSDDEIDWIANEGVRVSRIVAALQKPGWGDKKPLLDALLEGRRAVDTSAPDRGTALPVPDARNGAAIAADPARPVASAPAALRERATVIHVHGNATFYMGSGASSEAAADRDEGAAALEKQLRFDPDYAQREGYQRDFLGVEIALPGIVAARKPEMLKGPGNRVLVLRYHHYSLAMNQDRRFQMWSAVNVDYSAGARVHAQKREAFGTDHWVLDPRIPESLQVQDAEFYKPATRIDRGHVVRRDDSCWGSTFTATEYANSDTFHWTNCTPQHERFNQSKQAGLWGGLEDVIKERAEDGIERLSIFAGPFSRTTTPTPTASGTGEVLEGRRRDRRRLARGVRVRARPERGDRPVRARRDRLRQVHGPPAPARRDREPDGRAACTGAAERRRDARPRVDPRREPRARGPRGGEVR
jgi:endonuclease G